MAEVPKIWCGCFEAKRGQWARIDFLVRTCHFTLEQWADALEALIRKQGDAGRLKTLWRLRQSVNFTGELNGSKLATPPSACRGCIGWCRLTRYIFSRRRSEEHTSELQSRG